MDSFIVEGNLDAFVSAWMNGNISNKKELLKKSLIYRQFDIAKFIFMNGIGMIQNEFPYYEYLPENIREMMIQYEIDIQDNKECLAETYYDLDFTSRNLAEYVEKMESNVMKMYKSQPRETHYEGRPIEYLSPKQKTELKQIAGYSPDKITVIRNDNGFNVADEIINSNFDVYFRVKYDNYWLYRFHYAESVYWQWKRNGKKCGIVIDKYMDYTNWKDSQGNLVYIIHIPLDAVT